MTKLEAARAEINEIDKEMTALFERRMAVAREIAKFKAEAGLPIYDEKREKEVIERNSSLLKAPELAPYYVRMQEGMMAASRLYQSRLIDEAKADNARSLSVELGERSYPIYIGEGLLDRADKFLSLERKCFILTDSGVPEEYARKIAYLCKEAHIFTVPEGEGSKSIEVLGEVLTAMCEAGLSRKDVLISVGGGVIGDLGGFAASAYMRGIDFYNVPTTLLAMVDSSIGGKCAINHSGIKNLVGAFKQPRAVLISLDALKTLSERHKANGMCEAIKMAATSNAQLFSYFEEHTAEYIYNNMEKTVTEAIKIKRRIVEMDEQESGIRRILNFGHTLGHGIEAETGMHELLHGECVSIGMIPMCAPEIREMVRGVLNKFGLPTEFSGDIENAATLAEHDKKASGGYIDTVVLPAIGEGEVRRMTLPEFKKAVTEGI